MSTHVRSDDVVPQPSGYQVVSQLISLGCFAVAADCKESTPIQKPAHRSGRFHYWLAARQVTALRRAGHGFQTCNERGVRASG